VIRIWLDYQESGPRSTGSSEDVEGDQKLSNAVRLYILSAIDSAAVAFIGPSAPGISIHRDLEMTVNVLITGSNRGYLSPAQLNVGSDWD
jgi:hypothetical protein